MSHDFDDVFAAMDQTLSAAKATVDDLRARGLDEVPYGLEHTLKSIGIPCEEHRTAGHCLGTRGEMGRVVWAPTWVAALTKLTWTPGPGAVTRMLRLHDALRVMHADPELCAAWIAVLRLSTDANAALNELLAVQAA